MRRGSVVLAGLAFVGAAGCAQPHGECATESSRPTTAVCPMADCTPLVRPERGLYDGPTIVEIEAAEGAGVFYTIDGSEPSTHNGERYCGPIEVSGSGGRGAVPLRMAAITGDGTAWRTTHTYVFPTQVLAQPGDPAGFPNDWEPGAPADYEMDALVIGAAEAEAAAGLAALPTLSLALDLEDLFGADGIYRDERGLDREVAASAELFFADDRPPFQIGCAARKQGGGDLTNGKLSMRLKFKAPFGPTKLRYPLFGDSAVEKFDTLVVDAHKNSTWTHEDEADRERAQYLRDAYAGDVQRALGSLAPHSVFVHLYLNGLYWGIYDVHERPDASFAAQHLGGEKEDYDVVKHSPDGVVDGDATAINELFARSRMDLSVDQNYAAVAAYLDIDDFLDYMLTNFYIGSQDWPHQNWYAARNRRAGSGFRFFVWDSEDSLRDIDDDVTGASEGPAELFRALLDNAGFRARLEARTAEAFGPQGPLYVDPALPDYDPKRPDDNQPAHRYARRSSEIDAAIVLESARWGDTRTPGDPYTRADWLHERDRLLDEYFVQRSAAVVQQLADL